MDLGIQHLFNSGNSSSKKTLWVRVADMFNKSAALERKAIRIRQVIAHDKSVREAISTIKQARDIIKHHGASEAIMAVFNEGNQLSDTLGYSIPTINKFNARQVGIRCCEEIETKVEESGCLVCKFFDELIGSLTNYIDQLAETAQSQKSTLQAIISGPLANISAIDPEVFNNEETYGYAQPIFMERVGALNILLSLFENGNLMSFATDAAEAFKVLGYTVETTTTAEAPVAEVRESTPEEVAAAAPAPTEVMNVPPETAVEDLAEVATPATSAEPVEVIAEPANVGQTETVAVLNWTPETLAKACAAVMDILNKAPVTRHIVDCIKQAKDAACGGTCDEAAVEQLRAAASSIGTAIELFGNALSELINQVVNMSAKLTVASTGETPVSETAATDKKRKVKKASKSKKFRSCNSFGSYWDDEEAPGDIPPAGSLPEDADSDDAPVEDPVGSDGSESDGEDDSDAGDDSAETPTEEKSITDYYRYFCNEGEENPGDDITNHDFNPEEGEIPPAGSLEEDEDTDDAPVEPAPEEGGESGGDGIDPETSSDTEESSEEPASESWNPFYSNKKKKRRARNYYDEEEENPGDDITNHDFNPEEGEIPPAGSLEEDPDGEDAPVDDPVAEESGSESDDEGSSDDGIDPEVADDNAEVKETSSDFWSWDKKDDDSDEEESDDDDEESDDDEEKASEHSDDEDEDEESDDDDSDEEESDDDDEESDDDDDEKSDDDEKDFWSWDKKKSKKKIKKAKKSRYRNEEELPEEPDNDGAIGEDETDFFSWDKKSKKKKAKKSRCCNSEENPYDTNEEEDFFDKKRRKAVTKKARKKSRCCNELDEEETESSDEEPVDPEQSSGDGTVAEPEGIPVDMEPQDDPIDPTPDTEPQPPEGAEIMEPGLNSDPEKPAEELIEDDSSAESLF